MHLAVDVLPQDVVGPVAVQVPGADQSPFRADRRGDVDPALALTALHWPVMHLAVDVLPQDVVGASCALLVIPVDLVNEGVPAPKQGHRRRNSKLRKHASDVPVNAAVPGIDGIA